MMTMYCNPYRRFSHLRQAMDRMFDESLAGTTANEREMTLAVDVAGDDDAFTIQALVPGLEADDLDIEILNNTVTIRGEFKCEGKEDAKYLICELPTGRFSRVITLPTSVDATKTEANIKDGVLVLRVPKAEAHRPKTVKITAA